MDFPGPLSISSLRSASNADLGLRPFQRVTAQVLAVTGTIAVLAIEGHPVVARLTSPDQAIALHSRGKAQFIVSKISDGEINLRIVDSEAAQETVPKANQRGPELAVRLLDQDNVPVTANNLMLARAVLNQGLSLTPGLLQELLGALSGYGSWGYAQAEMAAALKAAGLPVTAGSLSLAMRQVAQTGEALGQLISQLHSAGQNLPADLLKQINLNLQMLEELLLSVDKDSSDLAAQLKATISVLGQSLENALLEQAKNPEKFLPEKNLIALARFGQSLEQAGETGLARAVEKFLTDLRHQHFLNAKPEPDSGREACPEIGFRLEGERGATARLRISRESRTTPVDTFPALTRLILQVEVSQDETVEVDLALAGRQISTQVTAPNPSWCQQADTELPALESALQSLGYDMKEAKITVGDPQPFEGLKIVSGGPPLVTVNIEV